MHKPFVLIILVTLCAVSAMAQSQFPQRTLYRDPYRLGGLTDSSQLKLLQLRQQFTTRELARIKDSIKRVQTATNTLTRSSHSTTLTSGILSNSCGTKASFTPANDTTLYTGQAISFTNTSQNADSYEWINDVYNKTTSTDFTNFVPSVGITQIMLVAHRGDCTDTAVTYVVNNGTPPADSKRTISSYGLPVSNESANAITQAKTDGYLLAGGTGVLDDERFLSPYFVRVSETGCILWSRKLGKTNGLSVQSVIPTYDNGFVVKLLVLGTLGDTYLVRFDKDGNMLWSKYYQGNSDQNSVGGTIREMSDHSLMFLAGHYGGASFLLINLDEQGNIRWQKNYSLNDNTGEAHFTDLVEENGSLWVAGNYYHITDPNQWNTFPMLFKVDAATGNLQWSKAYTSPNKIYTWTGIHFYKDGLIMNGNADSLVVPYNNEYSNFETLLETDLDGNIREGKLIFEATQANTTLGDNLFVNDDNSLSIFHSGVESLDLQPGFADRAYYLRLDAGKNILWQNQYTGYTVGSLVQAAPTPAKGLAMVGQRMNSLQNPFYGFSNNIVLVKVDSNGRGPDAQCDMYETYSTMQDMSVTPYATAAVTVSDGSPPLIADLDTGPSQVNSELRYNCPDYVPLCSFMKLSGANAVCNLTDTFDFIVHKDPSCADPVRWTYDNANIKTTFQDGSKLRLIFKTPGVYTIRAEKPFPCADIVDSILVTVAPALLNFNLGNDTSICAGDSLVLKPTGKYNAYLWQDGSTNDSFIVKTAGDYQLTVTDSCGNTKPDMIHVDFKTSLPIDLGGTRNICPTDTVGIFLPVGTNPFSLTPYYNILPSPGGVLYFFPKKDTVYTLVVNEAGVCQRSGQLVFKIFPTRSVALGNDTAFCAGGVAGFSAGTGFSSYAWSNGSIADFIIVKDPGQYSVTATDQNGCAWRDTVSLTVYPPPAVQISGGTVICKDQSLVLDAGSGFTNYLWQDGTSAETYSVVDTGFYRVQVTDSHQCSGADSIHIESFAETPRQFLPSDTVVCSYLGALIQPKAEFAQYSWSTGETGKSIQVKTAGEYILNVIDQQGCRGSDSVRIALKDCEALLIFPNAFTPNHDGLNDVFRLKYPGHAADYNLQIFNRWGQKIFETSDTSLGWDGNLNNQLQPEGNYVWIVRYTDNSGKKQKLQGSVVLIR